LGETSFSCQCRPLPFTAFLVNWRK
jgi:hypothetical protein